MNVSFKFVYVSFLFVSLLAACGPSDPNTSQIESEIEDSPNLSEPNGYPVNNENNTFPAPTNETNSGYPAPDDNSNNFLQELPDITGEIGDPEAGTGIISGVLIQEKTEQGFVPLTPRGLYLAQIIPNDQGELALMRRGDDAPQAELLQTGIFIFRNVLPERYGLIIDVGFSQFPLVDESGDQIIVTVEDGEIIELGQILVEINE